MFMDALLLLSDAQAFTATALGTNVVDLGNPTTKNRIGSGEPLGLMVTVDVAPGGTSPTFIFEVLQDDNASLSSPTVVASRTILAADLAAGSKHMVPIPDNTPTERYLGWRATLGGTSPTITVTAGIMPTSMMDSSWRPYSKGYSN